MPDSGDLLNRHFEKASFGGYKAADVDSFMNELSIKLSQSGREVTELKSRLGAAEKKIADFESQEESLKSTLLSAQRLADKIKKEAEEKAEVTIQNAKIKAENLIDCAQSEIEMRLNEAERIKKEVSDFKLSVMRLYKEQLELINEIPAEKPVNSGKPETAADQSAPQAEVAAIKPEAPAESSNSLKQEPNLSADISADAFKKPAEKPAPAADGDTCEFVLGKHAFGAGAAQKTVKTTALPRKPVTIPEKIQEARHTEDEQTAINEAAATAAVTTASDGGAAKQAKPDDKVKEESFDEPVKAAPAVKLNLRYNEKTGEYEPIGALENDISQDGEDGGGLRFGADYNLHTDSFSESDNKAGRRSPWHK